MAFVAVNGRDRDTASCLLLFLPRFREALVERLLPALVGVVVQAGPSVLSQKYV